MSSELAIRDTDYMPVLSIQQSVQRYNAVVDFTKQVMKRDRDFGVIPGTGTANKPGQNVLLKPGAEKLCTLFGLTAEFAFDSKIEDFDKGLFYYVCRCSLLRGAHKLGEGIGSANTWEKKHRRAPSRVCPACGTPNIKKSAYPPKNAPNAEPGWYCNSKGGGCGKAFAADDPAILQQPTAVDPRDGADLINTVQKMAQKRALIAATLIVTNASEFFTQDMEDAVIEGQWSESAPTPKTQSADPADTAELERLIEDAGVKSKTVAGWLEKAGVGGVEELDAAKTAAAIGYCRRLVAARAKAEADVDRERNPAEPTVPLKRQSEATGEIVGESQQDPESDAAEPMSADEQEAARLNEVYGVGYIEARSALLRLCVERKLISSIDKGAAMIGGAVDKFAASRGKTTDKMEPADWIELDAAVKAKKWNTLTGAIMD